MAKMLECAKVDPSSGCKHVVRGETVEEVLQKAAEHAKEHGIRQVPPELIEEARRTFNLEEYLAAVREIEETGGLQFKDFIEDLERAAGRGAHDLFLVTSCLERR